MNRHLKNTLNFCNFILSNLSSYNKKFDLKYGPLSRTARMPDCGFRSSSINIGNSNKPDILVSSCILSEWKYRSKLLAYLSSLFMFIKLSSKIKIVSGSQFLKVPVTHYCYYHYLLFCFQQFVNW